MKSIHLLRHAKSSWDDPTLADISRPLNQRGIAASTLIANHLKTAGCDFSHVFCSPAVRAQSTIQQINECLPTKIAWNTDEKLYTFEVSDLINWLSQLDNAIASVMIVAHNPALTDLWNQLCPSSAQHIPTCAYVNLVDNTLLNWKDLLQGDFRLRAFITPKSITHKT